MTKPPYRRSVGDELPTLMSQLTKKVNIMTGKEIYSVCLDICGNIVDSVRHLNTLIKDKKIEPALKVKMLATSITALTEVRDLYQELLDAITLDSDNSISE